MLAKTKAIVLHHIKYSESSIIVYVYTEQLGRQSYLIRGINKKNSAVKRSIFQPLYLLQLEAYSQKTKTLHSIKSAEIDVPFQSIPYDIRKSTVALFISEILYRAIKEEEANATLFNYLYHSIQVFDLLSENFNNFSLCFLMQLSKFLGFYPLDNYSEINSFFDLQEGVFSPTPPPHRHYLSTETSRWFHILYPINLFDSLQTIVIPKAIRNELLIKMMEYYRLHLEGLGEIKSLAVLQEVFK